MSREGHVVEACDAEHGLRRLSHWTAARSSRVRGPDEAGIVAVADPVGVPRRVPVLLPDAAPAPVPVFDQDGHLRQLEQIERDLIELAIDHYSGHMSEVARRLGIGRSTLYRKLREYGLEEKAAAEG